MPSLEDDPEFNEKNAHLDAFIRIQHLCLTQGRPLSFANEREKLRYLCFMLGAIDQLARTIRDPDHSTLWQFTASSVQGLMLFGVHEASERIEKNYGNPRDAELYDAGRRGFEAMRTYALHLVDKVKEKDFEMSCTELSYVVKGRLPGSK